MAGKETPSFVVLPYNTYAEVLESEFYSAIPATLVLRTCGDIKNNFEFYPFYPAFTPFHITRQNGEVYIIDQLLESSLILSQFGFRMPFFYPIPKPFELTLDSVFPRITQLIGNKHIRADSLLSDDQTPVAYRVITFNPNTLDHDRHNIYKDLLNLLITNRYTVINEDIVINLEKNSWRLPNDPATTLSSVKKVTQITLSYNTDPKRFLNIVEKVFEQNPKLRSPEITEYYPFIMGLLIVKPADDLFLFDYNLRKCKKWKIVDFLFTDNRYIYPKRPSKRFNFEFANFEYNCLRYQTVPRFTETLHLHLVDKPHTGLTLNISRHSSKYDSRYKYEFKFKTDIKFGCIFVSKKLPLFVLLIPRIELSVDFSNSVFQQAMTGINAIHLEPTDLAQEIDIKLEGFTETGGAYPPRNQVYPSFMKRRFEEIFNIRPIDPNYLALFACPPAIPQLLPDSSLEDVITVSTMHNRTVDRIYAFTHELESVLLDDISVKLPHFLNNYQFGQGNQSQREINDKIQETMAEVIDKLNYTPLPARDVEILNKALKSGKFYHSPVVHDRLNFWPYDSRLRKGIIPENHIEIAVEKGI